MKGKRKGKEKEEGRGRGRRANFVEKREEKEKKSDKNEVEIKHYFQNIRRGGNRPEGGRFYTSTPVGAACAIRTRKSEVNGYGKKNPLGQKPYMQRGGWGGGNKAPSGGVEVVGWRTYNELQ